MSVATVGGFDILSETTLFVAPFFNSYNRFQGDSFAGVTRCWSLDNVLDVSRYGCSIFREAVTSLELRRYYEMS